MALGKVKVCCGSGCCEETFPWGLSSSSVAFLIRAWRESFSVQLPEVKKITFSLSLGDRPMAWSWASEAILFGFCDVPLACWSFLLLAHELVLFFLTASNSWSVVGRLFLHLFWGNCPLMWKEFEKFFQPFGRKSSLMMPFPTFWKELPSTCCFTCEYRRCD